MRIHCVFRIFALADYIPIVKDWVSSIWGNKGFNDNFNLKTSHVIPALIRKFYDAKKNNHNEIKIWGSGKVKRDFLYVDDLANAIVFLLNVPQNKILFYNKNNIFHLNAGYGKDVTIKQLVNKLKYIANFDGKIIFDTKMPDGVPRKLLDSTLIKSLGWTPKVSLEEGLIYTFDWFKENI